MKQVYNPYLPLNEYIPDGEPHIFGDRIYIFGSHDRAGGTTFCELDYVVYSADINDLTDWRCEGTIYSALQDPHHTEIVDEAGERKYLYAPDVAQGPDGRYYLYYCLSAFAGKGGFDGPISVAVCDTPAGKYEYYGDVHYPDGTCMQDFIPFDPGVINDDGNIRLYYGWALSVKPAKSRRVEQIYRKVMHSMFPKKTIQEIYSADPGIMGANVLELEKDMITVKQPPKRIIPCEMDAEGTSFEGHAFFEGSSIRKINGMYYFIYSSAANHELCYAVSQYPDRGFEYGGVIISNGDIGFRGRQEKNRVAATGNNHGSIEQINGQWYIFYHRHTHLSTYSRQGCAERITLEKDGSIQQVCMTSCGLNGKPLIAQGEYPASIACNLTDGEMPHLGDGKNKEKNPYIVEQDGHQYITNIHDHTLIGYKYFTFQGETQITLKTRGKGKGVFRICTDHSETLTQISVEPSEKWRESSGKIRIEGSYAIYLIYEGSRGTELLSIKF